jgi:hypothetical protein
MRIAFLVGSAAPGRDGVGDYARALAAACVLAGHETCVVALNDPAVAPGETATEAPQTHGVVDVPTLRLSAQDPWEHRVVCAERYLASRGVDWVSLQFVPYALNGKGFVHGLASVLRRLAADRRRHLTCHELWVGAVAGAGWRHRLLGALQRPGVLALFRAFAPEVVHASADAYRAALSDAGWRCEPLPLFGNIPRRLAAGDWLGRTLDLPRTSDARGALRLGLFGAIHEGWDPDAVLTRLGAAAARVGRTVAVVSIGRQGPGGRLWSELAAAPRDGFSWHALGERSATEVSWFLQGLDAGLTTTPAALVEKSGTVAAMLEHGVPVIVAPQRREPRRTAALDSRLRRADDPGFDVWLASGPPRFPPADGAAYVAERFLAALETADSRRARMSA